MGQSNIIFENNYICVYWDGKIAFKFNLEEEIGKYKYSVTTLNGNNFQIKELPLRSEDGKFEVFFKKMDQSGYYFGTMMDEKLDGEGIYYFSPNNFYAGEFQDGNYCGNCCFVYENYILVGEIEKCKMGKANYAKYKNATILRGDEIYTSEIIEIEGDDIKLSGTMTHEFQKKKTIKIPSKI